MVNCCNGEVDPCCECCDCKNYINDPVLPKESEKDKERRRKRRRENKAKPDETFVEDTSTILTNDTLESTAFFETGDNILPEIPSPRTIANNDKYEEENEWFSHQPEEPEPEPPLLQYSTSTPSPTHEDTSTIISNLSTYLLGTLSDHSPGAYAPHLWPSAEWDGTPFPGDITTAPKEELCAWIRPTQSYFIIKGLKQRFDELNPFQDIQHPTIAEIDNWHIEVIKHFRALFGVTLPIKPNARLFLEARWASERYITDDWDTKYPGTYASAEGPCSPWYCGNPHCGAAFFPDAADRQPYIDAYDVTKYPELSNYNSRYSLIEGNYSAYHPTPWSLKLAGMFAWFICNEGYIGHTLPIFTREEFGCDWYYEPGSSMEAGSPLSYRGKWH